MRCDTTGAAPSSLAARSSSFASSTTTVDETGENPTKALRQVLESAIQKMKPDGAPNLNAPEWLLYNILDMRFIQGRRVREIADRLAISESDLYRKQRVAVGQVAQVLAEMERQDAPVRTKATGSPDKQSSGSADSASAGDPEDRPSEQPDAENEDSAEPAPAPEKEM